MNRLINENDKALRLQFQSDTMVQCKPEHLSDNILQIGHKISNKMLEYINVEIKLIQGIFAKAKEKLLARSC